MAGNVDLILLPIAEQEAVRQPVALVVVPGQEIQEHWESVELLMHPRIMAAVAAVDIMVAEELVIIQAEEAAAVGLLRQGHQIPPTLKV